MQCKKTARRNNTARQQPLGDSNPAYGEALYLYRAEDDEDAFFYTYTYRKYNARSVYIKGQQSQLLTDFCTNCIV